MTQKSVLIVGAGSMGLVIGYYLQRGGTKVTFLVRPGKKQQSKAPSVLYCYDDGTLKYLNDYDVEDDVAALADKSFDYAIVTFDHAIAESEEGTALLRALGKILADKETILITGGVGLGLREHFLRTTGLPEERILNGILGLLSHQTTADLPINPPTDAKLLKSASMAYRHLGPTSMFVDSTFPEAAATFAEIYNRNQESTCDIMDKTQFAVLTSSAFPMLAAAEVAGWCPIAELVAQTELWALSCDAQREIAALPEFGPGNDAIVETMTNEAAAGIHVYVEQAAMPLDYQAFNRFHHGGKVSGQDFEIMRKCAVAGQRGGRPMTALSELMRRLEDTRSALQAG